MVKRIRNRLLILLTDKEKKEGRRITQTEIAKAIHVSVSTIGGWLQQEIGRVDENVLIGLCDYFNCNIEDLIYIEVTDDPPADNAS
ncbi:helix-turn-helix transcriptional regulator [bacterium]|nr:helix-turn-helix transcriptional regulator [bacterium]